MNTLQKLVLGFFAVVWISLVAILVASPEVYDQVLRLPSNGYHATGRIFLVAISAFIGLLCVGVQKRWSWVFWLILVAFLFGILRVPASFLELAGILPSQSPVWYMMYQAFLGLAQFYIGVRMLIGYRRFGIWGER